MTIKAHCMGTEFPKRDAFDRFLEGWAKKIDPLPSAEDLDAYVDAVAEEQKAKEQTSGKTDRSQP